MHGLCDPRPLPLLEPVQGAEDLQGRTAPGALVPVPKGPGQKQEGQELPGILSWPTSTGSPVPRVTAEQGHTL